MESLSCGMKAGGWALSNIFRVLQPSRGVGKIVRRALVAAGAGHKAYNSSWRSETSDSNFPTPSVQHCPEVLGYSFGLNLSKVCGISSSNFP